MSKQPNTAARQANRGRLFRSSKPTIREAKAGDEVWIRVNQKMQGIESTDEEFQAMLELMMAQYGEIMIIEDRNKRFGAEFGPIGIVAAVVRGPVYEPHVEWFSWATPQNILRGAVAYFQRGQYRKLGVMVVHCLDDAFPFYRRLKKYIPLRYVGKIPDGDIAGRGTDYLFYQRCLEHELPI
jgi:hypothetical protein